MTKLISRLLILLLVLALVACGSDDSEPAAESEPAEEPAKEEAAAPVTEPTATPEAAAKAEEPAPEVEVSQFSEAPELAAMVEAGELPAVDERLPTEPFVVGPGILISEENLPDWEVGQYGGTIRAAHSVPDWAPDVFVMSDEPLLSAPDLTVANIRGGVLKDFEVSDDNKQFTFHMREGLKWSDGEPVTSEDIRFVYEDIYLNEELTPAFPSWARTGGAPDGVPMVVEIVDDFTFTVTFDEAYGGFLRQWTIESWSGYPLMLRPAHYLKQFHKDYATEDELAAAIEEAELEEGEWVQLFGAKDCQHWHLTRPRCIGFPSLYPWIGAEAEQPGVLVFERNPYYFKVDTAGQQLPYIDKIISVQAEDVEAVNLKVLVGEVDFLRESTGLVKIPLYKENEEQAGFEVRLLDMHVDSSNIFINQTFDDPVWQQVTQDLRFRQAASLAINRDAIIDTAYFGFANKPVQNVGDEFTQFDPERANQLLDEVGLDQRGDDGFRLGPDGEPFQILLEQGAHAPDIAPVSELVTEYLRDVGLDVQMKQIDTTLWGQRRDANELQMTVFWSHDQGWDSNWTTGTLGFAGREWHNWRTSNGTAGIEPPEWVKEAIEIDAKRWSAVSGSPEYIELREAGYAWHRDNLPLITIVENVKYPMIFNTKLRNIPSGGYAIAANFEMEQAWFAE